MGPERLVTYTIDHGLTTRQIMFPTLPHHAGELPDTVPVASNSEGGSNNGAKTSSNPHDGSRPNNCLLYTSSVEGKG